MNTLYDTLRWSRIQICNWDFLWFQMRTPRALMGWNGVLNTSMVIVTCLYIAVGFFGYLKYGEDVLGSITLNLPVDQWSVVVICLSLISIFLSLISIFLSFFALSFCVFLFFHSMSCNCFFFCISFRIFLYPFSCFLSLFISFFLSFFLYCSSFYIASYYYICLGWQIRRQPEQQNKGRVWRQK